MNPALRKYKIFFLLTLGVGCGDSDTTTDNLTPVSLIAGSDVAKFYDRQPQQSSDGSKIAFISRRPHSESDLGGLAKVYLHSNNALQQLTASVTGLATARELDVALSPDGNLAAIFAKVPQDGSDDLSQLWIVKTDGSAANQVTAIESSSWIDHLAFSPNSTALVYTQWTDEAVASFYSTIDANGAVTGTSDPLTGEQNIQVNVNDSTTYLLTEEEGSYTRQLNLYSVTSGTTVGTPNSLTDLAKSQLPTLLTSEGLLYHEPLETPRLKDRLGNRVDVEEVSNRGAVFIEHQLVTRDFSLQVNDLGFQGDYLVYEPVEPVTVANSNGYSLVLGGDYYVCSNSVIYGATFSIVKQSNGAVGTFMVTVDETTRVPTALVADPCTATLDNLASALQPFENRIVDLAFAATNDAAMTVTFESWDSGDPEIYQINFGFSDFSTTATAAGSFAENTAIKVISNNPFEIE